MSSPLKLALIGNLCDNAVIFWRLLRAEDLQISLYMSSQELRDCTVPELVNDSAGTDDERIRHERNREPRIRIWDHAPKLSWVKKLPLGNGVFQALMVLRFAYWLHREDVVISFAMYHIVAWLSRRPYMAFCTGADLHEVAIERSYKGWLMRKALKRSRLVQATLDEISRENGVRLKLSTLQPFRIPWRISSQCPEWGNHQGPTKVFMPSNQDWCDPRRAGLAKRNDLFIRAWARRIDEGWESILTIVAHGPDIEATRRLVEELGIARVVRFIPRLDQTHLQAQIDASDLVADQFDQGVPGALALQTLASGRALGIFWDTSISALTYLSVPPILNGKSEEELYEALRRHPSREDLQELGRKGYEWMKREYEPQRLRSQLRFAISLAVGRSLSLEGDDADD